MRLKPKPRVFRIACGFGFVWAVGFAGRVVPYGKTWREAFLYAVQCYRTGSNPGYPA